MGEDAIREPLGVGPVWAMRWLVALWVASVARGSARSSLDALFSSLGQAYHAQRRLAQDFGTCAKARKFYKTEELRRETASLLKAAAARREPAAADDVLVFIHIPKNAGYSIERMLDEKGSEKLTHLKVMMDVHDSANEIQWAATGNCSCQPHHVPPRYFQAAGVPDPFAEAGRRSFCVVRDPLDKVMSQFRHHTSLKMLEDQAYTEYKLCAMMMRRHTNACNLAINNCHVYPQYEYIWDASGRRTCDHVLYFERLAVEFNALMRARGEAVELPSLSQFTSNRSADLMHHNHSDDAVIASGVSDRLSKAIRCAYQMDVCLLGMRLADGSHTTRHDRIFEECADFHDTLDDWSGLCRTYESAKMASYRQERSDVRETERAERHAEKRAAYLAEKLRLHNEREAEKHRLREELREAEQAAKRQAKADADAAKQRAKDAEKRAAKVRAKRGDPPSNTTTS